tara:strand:- start:53 stop:1897 length:1845 start_codon:yes stop_codon:yes gene_type:complete
MGETNWLKPKKEGFKAKIKKKKLKESFESKGISENDEIEVKLKEIHDKKHILTQLPPLDNIYDKQEIKEEKTESSNESETKESIKEGFTNNVDFAYLELEKEMEDLGVKGVFEKLEKIFRGEFDFEELEKSGEQRKGDRWCKDSDKSGSGGLITSLKENFDIFPALIYSIIPCFQYVIKKIVIFYCDIVDVVQKKDESKESDRKLLANEFLRFITAYVALFATYNWFFLWCFVDKDYNYLDESGVKPDYGKKQLENKDNVNMNPNAEPSLLNWKGFLFQYHFAGIGLLDYFFTAHSNQPFNANLNQKEKVGTYSTLPWLYELIYGFYPLKFLLLYFIFFIGMGCGSELIYDINYAPFEKFLKGLATPDRLNMKPSVSLDEKIKAKLSAAKEEALKNSDFLLEGLPKAAITMIITFEVLRSLASSVNGPLNWFDYLFSSVSQMGQSNSGTLMKLLWEAFRILMCILIFAARIGSLYTFYPLIYVLLVTYFLYHTFYSVFAYKPKTKDDESDHDYMFKYIELIDEMVATKEGSEECNTSECEKSIFSRTMGILMRMIRLGINKYLHYIIGIVMIVTTFMKKFDDLSDYLRTSIIITILILSVFGYMCYTVYTNYNL